jgi:hypothetical protein
MTIHTYGHDKSKRKKKHTRTNILGSWPLNIDICTRGTNGEVRRNLG